MSIINPNKNAMITATIINFLDLQNQTLITHTQKINKPMNGCVLINTIITNNRAMKNHKSLIVNLTDRNQKEPYQDHHE